jgi:hypothetical protein
MLFSGVSLYSQNSQAYSALCSKATELLKNDKPDSALLYYTASFKNGMPRDSFFYFWAEVLIGKKAPDSAFVLNVSISPDIDKPFKKLVLKQRYVIFSMLKWDDKASEVLDTLTRMYNAQAENKKYRYYLPKLAFSSGGTFNNETDGSYIENPKSVDVQKFDYNGRLSLRWSFPLFKQLRIRPALGGSFSNNNNTSFFSDSTGRNLYISNDFSLGNVIDIGYSYRAYLGINNEFTYSNEITAGKYMLGEKQFGMIYANLMFYSGSDAGSDSKYFILLGYYERELNRKRKLLLNITFNAQNSPDASYHLYNDLKDSSGLNNSIVIDETGMPDTLHDTLHIELPQKRISVEDNYSFQIPLGAGFSATIAAEHTLNVYTHKFEWYSFEKPANDEISMLQKLYNNDGFTAIYEDSATKEKYIIAYTLEDTDLIIARSVHPIVKKVKQRIDNSFALSFGLGKTIGKIGNVSLGAKVWKNFSTLSDDTPVTIPDWGYNLSLRLSLYVSFKK